MTLGVVGDALSLCLGASLAGVLNYKRSTRLAAAPGAPLVCPPVAGAKRPLPASAREELPDLLKQLGRFLRHGRCGRWRTLNKMFSVRIKLPGQRLCSAACGRCGRCFSLLSKEEGCPSRGRVCGQKVTSLAGDSAGWLLLCDLRHGPTSTNSRPGCGTKRVRPKAVVQCLARVFPWFRHSCSCGTARSTVPVQVTHTSETRNRFPP